MRLINKKTICATALGLLLLYIIRKRKTADERPVSNDDAHAYSNLAESAPVASVRSIAHPAENKPTDVAPPTDSVHDTQADADVAAHPDISLCEDAFEQEDAALDEPPAADNAPDAQADTDVAAQPDISLSEDALEQIDTTPTDAAPPADNTQNTQANTAIDEPLPASEVTTKPKSPVSPQRKPSPQPPSTRQRQHAATRTPPKRSTRPQRYEGKRIPTGKHYPPVPPPSERASLRCRKTGYGWEIYLAFPQESVVSKVVHGGDELRVASETEMPLRQFTGEAVVHYQDDTADRITLSNVAERNPLFFKMQKDWEGVGRLVNSPTAGRVLVIVPPDYDADEWKNAEDPRDHEDCVDDRFEARFLFLEGGAPGRPAPMRIEGTTLRDADEIGHHGKLYIGAPPELHVDHQITDAQIVEETGGIKSNEWIEDFDPHRKSIASVLDGREGRFYIRTYHDGQKQESKPFRYFPALRRITLNGKPHSPVEISLSPDKLTRKHRDVALRDVVLRFELNNGDVLHPESVSQDEVRVVGNGAVIIPQSPSIRTLTCVFPNGASIVVAVPRVLWRQTDEDDATGDWWGLATRILPK